MRLTSVLALGLGAAMMWPASAAADECRPLGGVQSANTRTADRAAGGSEITEYFGDASYRVSRCAADGRLEVSQVVAPLRARDGTRMTPTSLFLSDGTPRGGRLVALSHAAGADGYLITNAKATAAASAARPAGLYSTAKVIPPTDGRAAAASMSSVARAIQGPDIGCRQEGYALWGLQIARGYYAYRARLRRMPNGEADRAAITRGHHAWNYTRNPCGLLDVTNVLADYVGETASTVHTYNDGVNVVDFGDPAALGCVAPRGQLTLACTQGITLDGATFSDIDQRYSSSVRFYNGRGQVPSTRWDLWSVATHESGHAVGLEHFGAEFLSMNTTIGAGQRRARDLGLGDVRGLNCRYGVTTGGC